MKVLEVRHFHLIRFGSWSVRPSLLKHQCYILVMESVNETLKLDFLGLEMPSVV